MSRSLPSLAHALCVAPELDTALVALGEALAESDRTAQLGLLRYDLRREMLRERLTPTGGRVTRTPVDTTFDHLPGTVRTLVSSGGQFVDLGERSQEYARLFGLPPFVDGGILSLRGLKIDGHLAAVVALYEQRRMFGTRTSERLAPAVALFELSYSRFADREAREEAVRTLEDVTQRVHGEYVKKLAALEQELTATRDAARNSGRLTPAENARIVSLERETAQATEDARRAQRRAHAIEQQVAAAIGQLEQAHIELHRRSEALRQKTRTLYLIERVLRLDATATDPRQLVDGLLALVGDDMQAQRCSLMLRAPEPGYLYLAASRGLAPHIVEGSRIVIGEGVAGRVAAAREPLLVQDVSEAREHPLLQDQFFTTGSFISFPLVYRGELVGVVNLTNRAQRGVFVEEDVERVRVLALVTALIAWNASLAERLIETIPVP
jgi:GAF domain-containing protein